jgi:hypothetical protein
VPPLDYLRDELATAFFDAREHEAYYRSLKSSERPKDARRAFHDTLRPVFLRLLVLANDDGIVFLEHLITANIREEKRTQGVQARGSPAERVRRAEPRGMKILGDDAGRDLEHLRTAYRAAALRSHPDLGGSHEDMKAVNGAFEMLHRLLVEAAGAEPIVGEGDNSREMPGDTTNALAYLWTVRQLLLGIALDEWALEEAIAYLEELVPVRAPRPAPAENTGIPFLIYNSESERIRRTYDLLEQACRLTVRLCAARCADSAARSLAIARELHRLIREYGARNEKGGEDVSTAWVLHPPITSNFVHPSLRKAEECIAGRSKPPIVLDSVKQVENAFRLGAIDRKRYKASLSRVTKTASRVGADRRERLAILARTRFAPLLPSDAQLKPSRNPGRIVPHPPPYIGGVKDLTPDQQAMYLEAFRSAHDLDLVAIYARFRLGSIFESAILFPERCDLAALAEEADALAQVGFECRFTAGAAALMIRLIAELDDSRRAQFTSELAKRGFYFYVDEQLLKLVKTFAATTATVGMFREHMCDFFAALAAYNREHPSTISGEDDRRAAELRRLFAIVGYDRDKAENPDARW